VENGAIAAFVCIARKRQGKLRSIAVEALRVLSEDVSPTRQTRLSLCEGGTASALGIALKDDVSLIAPKLSPDRAFRALNSESLKRLHQAVCALANILDPIQEPTKSTGHGPSSQFFSDPRAVLIKGCLDTARDGGLDSILKIASLPFNASHLRETASSQQGSNMYLMEEACRSLASMSPLLLTDSVAEAGYSKYANDVLNVLHDVLEQLVNALDTEKDSQRVNEKAIDLHEVVLQGLGALAKSDPLKIRIIDRTLPFLMRAVSSRDVIGTSSAVNQALQSLDFTEDDFAEDEDALQVAANNPSLVADWFCLQRSLLIQAMARAEIRHVLAKTWGLAFSESSHPGLTNLIRDLSGKSRSDDGNTLPPDLFDNFANDETTFKKRKRLIRQYHDICGQDHDLRVIGDASGMVETKSLDADTDGSKGFLACQMYPLNSSSTETHWILEHRRFIELSKDESSENHSPLLLSPHVDMLLDTCFPSRLLRDQIVPISSLRPEASFNFRALMMPEREYFSCRQELKLLNRICRKEAQDTDGVHWTLGFTNSSFGGEFAESLVQLLYLCPMIKGLSFVNNGKCNKTQDADKEAKDNEGSGLLASLAGSLPPWMSHLTFDGVLNEDDLATLVSILEAVGRLSSGQDMNVDNSSDSVTIAQGRFSFLAIRKSSLVSPDVWQKFFGLFKNTAPNMNAMRPLSTLRSLDLSFNGLGDDLCSSILNIVYHDEFSCCLEELDLSGNIIRCGTKVIKELERMKTRASRASNNLNTLRLAANNLNIGDAWHAIVAILEHKAFRLRVLDLSSNEIFLTDYDQTETLVRMILNSKYLVRLNLSNNSFNSKAVDDVVRQLLDSPSLDCALGFLDLENNDPRLTVQQTESLGSFLSRSRCVLLGRCVAERESKEFELETEAEVSPEDNADDRSLGDIPDTATVFSLDSAHENSASVPSDNLITVMFSAPLVYNDNRGILHPFAKLNFDLERELIWQCLKEASRDIELSFDNATHDRLLATITKRCSCLHYSGHGHQSHLTFEDGDGSGGPRWFPVDEFKELIKNEAAAPFRFVFVSACYSGLAGEAFASAGVPHVVCCQQEYELKDAAALAFTRQFYLALAVGNTVKESFEQGRKAVRATPNLKDAEEEMKKFVLLPLDGDHDVPIFKARRVREWPRSLCEEARRYRRTSGVHNNSWKIAARSAELTVRNLVQEDPSPSPPQFFLGREVEMYRVLKQLLNKR
jgi:hypothetical protein